MTQRDHGWMPVLMAIVGAVVNGAIPSRMPLMSRSQRTLATVLTLLLTAGVAHAQPPGDCSRRISRAVGFAVGWSLDPYLELSPGAFDGDRSGSLSLRRSLHAAARLDLPIAGPWRGRIEVSGANWPVERQHYDGDFQPISKDSVGAIEARQLVALVGRQGGRSGACGYVLAGGGLFSIGRHGSRVLRPGAALTAGMEVPVTRRGAVQLDMQLHMFNAATRDPVARNGGLAPNISVGWAHRF